MYLFRFPSQLALAGSFVFGVCFSMYFSRVGRSADGTGVYPGRRWNSRPWSVEPWTLDSPRRALMPPPATPTFPSRSWTMDMARMFWVPTVCCVHPIAYSEVPDLSGLPVAPYVSYTFRRTSFGVPVISETSSGVYRE